MSIASPRKSRKNTKAVAMNEFLQSFPSLAVSAQTEVLSKRDESVHALHPPRPYMIITAEEVEVHLQGFSS